MDMERDDFSLFIFTVHRSSLVLFQRKLRKKPKKNFKLYEKENEGRSWYQRCDVGDFLVWGAWKNSKIMEPGHIQVR